MYVQLIKPNRTWHQSRVEDITNWLGRVLGVRDAYDWLISLARAQWSRSGGGRSGRRASLDLAQTGGIDDDRFSFCNWVGRIHEAVIGGVLDGWRPVRKHENPGPHDCRRDKRGCPTIPHLQDVHCIRHADLKRDLEVDLLRIDSVRRTQRCHRQNGSRSAIHHYGDAGHFGWKRNAGSLDNSVDLEAVHKEARQTARSGKAGVE